MTDRALNECNCGQKFRTAEDYRDHLPCESYSHSLAQAHILKLEEALKPLVAIADAYDSNNLDDEARKWWGPEYGKQTFNETPQKESSCILVVAVSSYSHSPTVSKLEEAMKKK